MTDDGCPTLSAHPGMRVSLILLLIVIPDESVHTSIVLNYFHYYFSSFFPRR